MALMIRLRQQGCANKQTYRLVVIDQRNPRDGKYIEMLGWYNPLLEGDKDSSVKLERIQFWLDKGASLSEKARALVKRKHPEVIQSLEEKKRAKKLKQKKKPTK